MDHSLSKFDCQLYIARTEIFKHFILSAKGKGRTNSVADHSDYSLVRIKTGAPLILHGDLCYNIIR